MDAISPQWASHDPRRAQAVARALNVAGAGSVLMQTYINRIVQDLTLRELGVNSTLPRKPSKGGDKAYHNRRAESSNKGSWVADTGTATEAVGTHTQAAFTYRTLLAQGRVTRKMQAIGQTFGDLLADEMMFKTDEVADTMETAWVQGNNAASAQQPDGLLTLIGAVSGQVVANTSSINGQSLVLSKLDEAIDKVKGSGTRKDLRIYGSFKGRRLLNAALQAQQQFFGSTTIAGGFQVETYLDIPLVTSTQIPDTLNWSGTQFLSFSGGTSTALIIVNTRYCHIEDLTPLTVMPLAKTSSQFDDFDIFTDTVLAYTNTLGGALLGGLA
jgi:hypothetical protein